VELHEKARIKLAGIGAATSLQDFQELRGNRLEALKGDRKTQYSTRIKDQFRICFKWDEKHAFDVEIVDYH
jgi:proteic killer suppression protein